MSKSFNVLSAVDKPTIFIYLTLVIFGLMNIYGASYSEEQTSLFDLSYRSGKQILWIGISFVAAFCILFSSKSLYSAVAYWLYGFIILVLILTLFVATDIKGSRSWISLGGFSIQPFRVRSKVDTTEMRFALKSMLRTRNARASPSRSPHVPSVRMYGR